MVCLSPVGYVISSVPISFEVHGANGYYGTIYK